MATLGLSIDNRTESRHRVVRKRQIGASRSAQSPQPGFAFLIVAFVGFIAVGLRSYTAGLGIGAIRWYTSVVWTLPILISTVGLAGGVLTIRRTRRLRNTGASPAPVANRLVVVVPTIGRDNTIPALTRVVHSLCEHLPPYFPLVRIDLVIDENCEAHERVAALAARSPGTRIITVPTAYRTRHGTRFKARANHYAHEVRIRDAETSDDVWVLHMDDDTGVGPDTAAAMAEFIHDQSLAGDRALHLAQGVLSFPREHSRNELTWLADAVRPGCDVSLFAASTGRGWPWRGLHGELLLIRASVEASIGWDFGPRSICEDADFAMRFCQFYPGRSGWISGRSYGASPATIADFVRQRERWVCGLLEVSIRGGLPFRRRMALMHGVVLWACGPIQHPAVVLAVGAALGQFSTSPAIAILVPIWAFNGSFFVWLYWEGLKINASSSRDPRRRWWEPLCLIALVPIFSLWEVTGVCRGLARFMRRGDPSFPVIAKPA